MKSATTPCSAKRSSASRTARSQLPSVMTPNVAPARRSMIGAGTYLAAAFVLARQAVDDLLVLVGDFGVAAVLVVARAAGEERALGVDAGQRAGGDLVFVFGDIAEELRDLFELLGVEHASAVGT